MQNQNSIKKIVSFLLVFFMVFFTTLPTLANDVIENKETNVTDKKIEYIDLTGVNDNAIISKLESHYSTMTQQELDLIFNQENVDINSILEHSIIIPIDENTNNPLLRSPLSATPGVVLMNAGWVGDKIVFCVINQSSVSLSSSSFKIDITNK